MNVEFSSHEQSNLFGSHPTTRDLVVIFPAIGEVVSTSQQKTFDRSFRLEMNVHVSDYSGMTEDTRKVLPKHRTISCQTKAKNDQYKEQCKLVSKPGSSHLTQAGVQLSFD